MTREELAVIAVFVASFWAWAGLIGFSLARWSAAPRAISDRSARALIGEMSERERSERARLVYSENDNQSIRQRGADHE